MSTFELLSKEPEIIKLIDEDLKLFKVASNAVAAWFIKHGGDHLNDSDYKAYRVKAVKILNELEIVREDYHDLLKDKGLLEIAAPKHELTHADLVQAVKSLADSTGKHASATEAQTKANLLGHKVPEMQSPIFNPNESKTNPLAWSNFWQKFELFCQNAVDDKSRMGFLLNAVKGDAFIIIKNLKCTDENFAVAKELLEKHYNKPNTIREKLLLQCLKFKVPKASSDLSGFVSSIINLNVYINELKLNHGIDILAEDSGCHLIRAVLQDILPGDILDKYQSLTGSEYPSLAHFISKAQEVADRIARKHKNFNKDQNNPGNQNSSSQNANASTIPSSISAINTRPTKPFKQKKCLFCGEQGHNSSRCPKHITLKDRAIAIKKLHGFDPCNKCLYQHKKESDCKPCQLKGCSNPDKHGSLTCPMILDQLKSKTSNNSSKSVNVTTNKRCCSVALPTFTAQIDSSVNDKSLQTVGVLMDTAAQQSLINREVVERLNIEPIRQEYTTLVGFGMQRPMA